MFPNLSHLRLQGHKTHHVLIGSGSVLVYAAGTSLVFPPALRLGALGGLALAAPSVTAWVAVRPFLKEQFQSSGVFHVFSEPTVPLSEQLKVCNRVGLGRGRDVHLYASNTCVIFAPPCNWATVVVVRGLSDHNALLFSSRHTPPSSELSNRSIVLALSSCRKIFCSACAGHLGCADVYLAKPVEISLQAAVISRSLTKRGGGAHFKCSQPFGVDQASFFRIKLQLGLGEWVSSLVGGSKALDPPPYNSEGSWVGLLPPLLSLVTGALSGCLLMPLSALSLCRWQVCRWQFFAWRTVFVIIC